MMIARIILAMECMVKAFANHFPKIIIVLYLSSRFRKQKSKVVQIKLLMISGEIYQEFNK